MPRKKRKASVSGTAIKSYKSGGRTYKKESCSATKTAAKKKQKSMHNNGKTAQVKKDPGTGKWCVYSAGNKKTKKRK